MKDEKFLVTWTVEVVECPLVGNVISREAERHSFEYGTLEDATEKLDQLKDKLAEAQ